MPYSKDEWANLPEKLILRQSKVTVNNPGFRTQEFYIITTLLDAAQYPVEELAETYFKRWDVELFFRDIKTTMGMDILRCQTPDMIRKEILMHFIAYNCVRRLMYEAAEEADLAVRVVSFKGSLQALRNWEPHLNQARLLILKHPWPSMLRSVWGDDERYVKQYFADIPGVYFTGDGAHVDQDGYFHVVGRIDDVLNVSGHRIGTAEIESALVSHLAVAEAAAVGRPDELKGQALVVFVTLKPGHEPGDATRTALGAHVAKEIGKFARPDEIRFADGLPKTRSGKIMRRLLKDVAAGREAQGDISTLEDLTVLAKLRGNDE
jgi:acyl-CoA synthetase (AMP-forming)/AMP-acid ligase II